MDTNREDVGISIRSAFLRKGTQQRFSLFILTTLSILLIFLESIETKPLDRVRSFIKDTIYIGASITLTGIVAILAGINIALVAYNIKVQRNNNIKKSGMSAFLGGTLTAFTPGCPACTTSLTAVLGVVGGLAIFPLQGIELKFISIIALTFSIWWAMRNINNSSCCVMEK